MKNIKLFEDFMNEKNTNFETLTVGDVYNIYDMEDNGKVVHQWAIYMGEKDGKYEFKSANLPKAEPYLIDKNDKKYDYIKKTVKKK